MNINTQPIEKVANRLDGVVEVFEIFDTIQGEGPFSGTPATFVRLAGCDLQCSWCDTDYSSHRDFYSPEQLLEKINELPRRELIVFTGGEPFRQDLTQAFLLILAFRDVDIQVETNGTIDPGFWEYFSRGELTIVCSPKTPKISESMWEHIDDLKYVVEHGQIDDLGFPLSSVGPQYGSPARPPDGWNGQIYIQPLDVQDEERNKLNRQTAVACCMKHGYRLCLQVHKIVDLP